MFDDFDPRDREHDIRDIEMPWIELGRGPGSDRDEGDPRDRDEDFRDRDRDPRDVFLEGLEFPGGLEREIVLDGRDRYELNGDDSRSLATVGAFRVVSERDLRDPRDESDPRQSDLRQLPRFPDRVRAGWMRPPRRRYAPPADRSQPRLAISPVPSGHSLRFAVTACGARFRPTALGHRFAAPRTRVRSVFVALSMLIA